MPEKPKSEKNDSIAVHLQAQARGRTPSRQMAFDPATGELVLRPRVESTALATTPALDPDAIVVDQIAETGFFARDPAAVATHGVVLTSAAAGGGTAGAGVGAGIGMAIAGPPGAAVGFLCGLAAGTAGGAVAGNELGKRIGETKSKGEK